MLGMSRHDLAGGQFVGARDFAQARRAAWVVLQACHSGTMVVVFWPPPVPGPTSPDYRGTVEITRHRGAIRLASIYTLADSAQLVFAGALRGAGDTRWVMRVSVGLHWVFSAAAIAMIRFLRISPVAAWMAFIIFIVLLGIPCSGEPLDEIPAWLRGAEGADLAPSLHRISSFPVACPPMSSRKASGASASA
jgi:MATE family multidrug resistance protein